MAAIVREFSEETGVHLDPEGLAHLLLRALEGKRLSWSFAQHWMEREKKWGRRLQLRLLLLPADLEKDGLFSKFGPSASQADWKALGNRDKSRAELTKDVRWRTLEDYNREVRKDRGTRTFEFEDDAVCEETLRWSDDHLRDQLRLSRLSCDADSKKPSPKRSRPLRRHK